MNQTSYQKLGGFLPIPPGPWHCMCMDFITSLPEPQGYDAILVMVKGFPKLAHMVPIVETATALKTSKVGEGTTVAKSGCVGLKSKVFSLVG